MKSRMTKFWKENRLLLIFIVLMSVFRSGVADWNEVPTGSMKPTIIEGDRILVNKMAYDLRVPFTHISLIKLADPARGDIVVFDSDKLDKRLVKRIVGLPGDIVAMNNNVLMINGQVVGYEEFYHDDAAVEKIEHLIGVDHLVKVSRIRPSKMSSFPPVKVPEDHYLVLGDNRDNSADSRFIGFIPRDQIVGRSRQVVLSLDYDYYYLPRPERLLHSLTSLPASHTPQ
ncbi:MAG: signal peptidase I [Gammaproteobacteria bacterium]